MIIRIADYSEFEMVAKRLTELGFTWYSRDQLIGLYGPHHFYNRKILLIKVERDDNPLVVVFADTTPYGGISVREFIEKPVNYALTNLTK